MNQNSCWRQIQQDSFVALIPTIRLSNTFAPLPLRVITSHSRQSRTSPRRIGFGYTPFARAKFTSQFSHKIGKEKTISRNVEQSFVKYWKKWSAARRLFQVTRCRYWGRSGLSLARAQWWASHHFLQQSPALFIALLYQLHKCIYNSFMTFCTGSTCTYLGMT